MRFKGHDLYTDKYQDLVYQIIELVKLGLIFNCTAKSICFRRFNAYRDPGDQMLQEILTSK